MSAPLPPLTPEKIALRLKSAIRYHIPGGCQIISRGPSCPCPLCDVERLLAQLTAAEQARDEARQFGEMAANKYNDLLANCAERTAVTCAFCGVIYPEGTPRSGHGALAEHIQTCEKHPMAALKAELAASVSQTQQMRERVTRELEVLRKKRDDGHLTPYGLQCLEAWEEVATSLALTKETGA